MLDSAFFSRLGLCCGLAIILGAPLPCPAADSFFAQYDVVFDGTDYFGTDYSQDLTLRVARLSADGGKIAFAGYGVDPAIAKTVWLVGSMNFDGSGLITLPVPVNANGDSVRVDDIAIDADGSRFFYATAWWDARIFKVEGGAATQVLDMGDYDALTPRPSGAQLRTSASGDYVWFLEDRDDIWRVSHAGGSPERLVDDQAVETDKGRGWAVSEFDISSDGSRIAFILTGYFDSSNNKVYEGWDQLFLYDGEVTQLTTEVSSKFQLALSGDGQTLVYNSSPNWYRVSASGGTPVALEPRGYNFGGQSLTADGEILFYFDSEAAGGRLTRTDGLGGMQIFPRWNVIEITLAATYDPEISDDGTRVSFRHDLQRIYAGTFGKPALSGYAPNIQWVSFDPAFMPAGDADASLSLTARMTDPQGADQIQRTQAIELSGGAFASWDEIPAQFSSPLRDDGTGADQTADDGIFSTSGGAAGGLDTQTAVTIRVSAMDPQLNVTVSDHVFRVGDARCSGETAYLMDEELLGNTVTSCVAASTLYAGPGVIAQSGARLGLHAPRVILRAGFTARAGSQVEAGP